MVTRRLTKNTPITHEELDENFRELRYDTSIQRVLENGNTTNGSVEFQSISLDILTTNSFTTTTNTLNSLSTFQTTVGVFDGIENIFAGTNHNYLISKENQVYHFGDFRDQNLTYDGFINPAILLDETIVDETSAGTKGVVSEITGGLYYLNSGSGTGAIDGFKTIDGFNYISFSGGDGSPGSKRILTSKTLDLSQSTYFTIDAIKGDMTNGAFGNFLPSIVPGTDGTIDEFKLYIQFSDDEGLSWTHSEELNILTEWSEIVVYIPGQYKITKSKFRIIQCHPTEQFQEYYFYKSISYGTGDFGGDYLYYPNTVGNSFTEVPSFGIKSIKIYENLSTGYLTFSDNIFSWNKVESSRTKSGTEFSVGIRTDGLLWYWGTLTPVYSSYNTNAEEPTQFPKSLTNFPYEKTFLDVAVGNSSIYVIDSENDLYVTGNNKHGQLGTNSTNQTDLNFQKLNDKWLSVYASGNSVFAIKKTDNTLWSWGQNDWGQLGIGNKIHQSSPVQVGQISESWTKVFPGKNHTLALRSDNTLWSWGSNMFGKLGVPNLYTQYRTYDTIDSYFGKTRKIEPFKKVVITNDTTHLGISNDNILHATVARTANNYANTPIASDILFESDGSYLINTGEEPFGVWDTNEYIEIFDGHQPPKFNSTSNVGQALSNFIIDTNNNLYVVETDNRNGLAGIISAYTYFSTPTQIPGSWKTGSVGKSSVFGITTDGSLYGWGSGRNLGLPGYAVIQSTPVLIDSGPWEKVFTGHNQNQTGFTSNDQQTTLAIKSDKTLWGWGRNRANWDGRKSLLKNLKTTNKIIATDAWGANTRPEYYANASGVLSIEDYDRTAYVIDSQKRLFVWGSADSTSGTRNFGTAFGQTANHIAVDYARQVGPYEWSDFSTSDTESGESSYTPDFEATRFGITTEGQLLAWGTNQFGQLGVGDTATRSLPTTVGVNKFESLSKSKTNLYHSAAIDFDGNLYTWGKNDLGQLGVYDNNNRSSPVIIERETTRYWTKVSCGRDNTLALKSDGTLWTTGRIDLSGPAGGTLIQSFESDSTSNVISQSGWTRGSFGSGTGSTGGASPSGIGQSWYMLANGYTGTEKRLVFQTIDYITKIQFKAIKGTGSNGLGAPESNEDLRIDVSSDGILWNQVGYIETTSVGGEWNTFTFDVNIPYAPNQTYFRICVTGASSPNDQWGIDSVYVVFSGDDVGLPTNSFTQVGTDTDWTDVVSGYKTILAQKSNGYVYSFGGNPNGAAAKVYPNSHQFDYSDTDIESPYLIGYSWYRKPTENVGDFAMTYGGGVWDFANTTIGIYIAGTGEGSSGGFVRTPSNSSTHWKFQGSGTRRMQTFPVDLTTKKSIAFNYIAGTGTNGGAIVNSDLEVTPYSYYGLNVVFSNDNGLTWSHNLVVGNKINLFTSFESSWRSVAVQIPDAYRTNNVIIRFYDGYSSYLGNENEFAIFDIYATVNEAELHTIPFVFKQGSIDLSSNTASGILVTDDLEFYNTSVTSANTNVPVIWGRIHSELNNSPIFAGSYSFVPSRLGQSNVDEFSVAKIQSLFKYANNQTYVTITRTTPPNSCNPWNEYTLNQSITQIGCEYVDFPTLVSDDRWNDAQFVASTVVGIKEDETLWTWGSNEYGKLGNNTSTSNHISVDQMQQVGSEYKWKRVMNSSNTVTAIREDGTLWTWGFDGRNRELGIGPQLYIQSAPLTPSPITSPIQIGYESDWKDLAGHNSTHVAVKEDGSLWFWGLNSMIPTDINFGNNLINYTNSTTVPSLIEHGYYNVEKPVEVVSENDNYRRVYEISGESSYTGDEFGSVVSITQETFVVSDGNSKSFFVYSLDDGEPLYEINSINNYHNYMPTKIASSEYLTAINEYFYNGSEFENVVHIVNTLTNERYSKIYETAYTSSPGSSTRFGESLSFDRDTVVISDYRFNGDQGEVYAIRVGDGLLLERLSNPSTYNKGKFGYSIDLSDNLLAVSSPNEFDGDVYGKVYIYDTGNWSRYDLPTLKDIYPNNYSTSNTSFGEIVKINSDYVAVTCESNPNGGTSAVRKIFIFSSKTKEFLYAIDDLEYYGREPLLVTRDKRFGHSISLAKNKNILAISDPEIRGYANNTLGIVYIYDLDERKMLYVIENPDTTAENTPPSDEPTSLARWFGESIELSDDGNVLVVGSPTANYYVSEKEGKVFVFELRRLSSSYWVDASAANSHSLAVKSDNTLWGWGHNSDVRFKPDIFDENARSSPVLLSASTSYAGIGSNHFGILTGTSLKTWGENSWGQLGLGNTQPQSSPVAIGTVNYNKLFFGSDVSFAINATNNLYAWGRNDYGQLGDNTKISKSSPVLIAGSWKHISTIDDTIIGTNTSGQVFYWGRVYGLETGGTIVYRSSPVLLSSFTNIEKSYALKSGNNRTYVIALNSSGNLFAQGNNSSKQFGSWPNTYDISAINSGHRTYYRKSADFFIANMTPASPKEKIYSWGANDGSLLGINSLNYDVYHSQPTQVSTSLFVNGWKSVATMPAADHFVGYGGGFSDSQYTNIGNLATKWGQYGTVALSESGDIWVWGTHTGRIGNYQNYIFDSQFSTPIVLDYTRKWNDVCAGTNLMTAIDEFGHLFIRGKRDTINTYDDWIGHKIRDLGLEQASVIEQLQIDPLVNTATALLSYDYNDNSVPVEERQKYLTGYNFNNASFTQIGSDTWLKSVVSYNWPHYPEETQFFFPSTIDLPDTWNIPASLWEAFPPTLYFNNVFLIKTDYTLWGFGPNVYGELGLGDNLPRDVITQIAPGHSWTQVSSVQGTTAAVRSDGTLWTWGKNNFGSLGVGQEEGFLRFVSSPVQVGTSNKWKDVRVFLHRETNPLVNRSTGIQTDWTHQQRAYYNEKLRMDDVCVFAVHTEDDGNDRIYGWGRNEYVIDETDWTILNPTNKRTAYRSNNITSNSYYQFANITSPVLVEVETLDTNEYPRHSEVLQLGDCTALVRDKFTGQNTRVIWGTGSFVQHGLNYSQDIEYDTSNTNQSIETVYTIPSVRQTWPIRSSYTSAIPIGTSYTWTDLTTSNSKIYAVGSPQGNVFSWGDKKIGVENSPTGGYINVSTSMYATDDSVFAIKSDGSVFAWGQNDYGQLNTGNTNEYSKNSPFQWTPTVKQVLSGNKNTIYITNLNSSYSLGEQTIYGYVGDSTPKYIGVESDSSFTLPIQLTEENNWSNVASSSKHALALKTNGTLWTWGQNNLGQLGLGDYTFRSSPTQVVKGPLTGSQYWKSIESVTESNSLAKRTDNSLWHSGRQFGSGNNTFDLIGNYSGIRNVLPISDRFSKFKKICSFHDTVVAISSDGVLYGWGDIRPLQIIGSNVEFTDTPIVISTFNQKDSKKPAPPAIGWIDIHISQVPESLTSEMKDYFIMVATHESEGTWIWSKNFTGEYGFGDTSSMEELYSNRIRYTPRSPKWDGMTKSKFNISKLPDPVTRDSYSWTQGITSLDNWSNKSKWKKIKVGIQSRLYGRDSGYGFLFSLFRAGVEEVDRPFHVGYVYGLDESGNLWVWGGNIGNVLFKWSNTPAGYYYLFNLRQKNINYANYMLNTRHDPWPYITEEDPAYRYYDASHVYNHISVPVLVGAGWKKQNLPREIDVLYRDASLDEEVASFSTGVKDFDLSYFMGPMILTNDHKLWTHPNPGPASDFPQPDDSTSLTVGPFPDEPYTDEQLQEKKEYYNKDFAKIKIFENVDKIFCGINHSAIITLDGLLYMWGDGSYGKLGDNSIVSKISPSLVSTNITNWKTIFLGENHTLGLTEDGILYGWGKNENGTLAQNDVGDDEIYYSTPVQIDYRKNFIDDLSFTYTKNYLEVDSIQSNTSNAIEVRSDSYLYAKGPGTINIPGYVSQVKTTTLNRQVNVVTTYETTEDSWQKLDNFNGQINPTKTNSNVVVKFNLDYERPVANGALNNYGEVKVRLMRQGAIVTGALGLIDSQAVSKDSSWLSVYDKSIDGNNFLNSIYGTLSGTYIDTLDPTDFFDEFGSYSNTILYTIDVGGTDQSVYNILPNTNISLIEVSSNEGVSRTEVVVSPQQTYTLTRSAANVAEGESFTITLDTTNVGDGTYVPYTITGVSSSDINDADLTGAFLVFSNNASVAFNTGDDDGFELTETFTLTLDEVDESIDVSISDARSYTIVPRSSINEGTNTNFTVNTTNVLDGTTLYWDINHITTSSNDFLASNGSLVINSDTGTFWIQPISGDTPAEVETFTINLRTDSSTGQIVATMGEVTVVDSEPYVAPITTPDWTSNVTSYFTYAVSSTQNPNIMNNYYRRFMLNFVISDAEIYESSGLTNGTIAGVRFNVVSVPTNQPYPNYQIGMKFTTGDISNGPSDGGYTEVKSPGSQSFVAGLNEISFDTPYVWTGGNIALSFAWGQVPTNYSSTGTGPISGQSWAGVMRYVRSDGTGSYNINSLATGSVNYRPIIQLYFS